MYIGRIMHTNLVTITPDASLVEARDLIERKNIDHLLVVNDRGKLVGILSDRDLKQYWASPATSLSKNELGYLLEKILVKMADGQFQVEVVSSVDEAQGLCRKMGAENWDHIGWVETPI